MFPFAIADLNRHLGIPRIAEVLAGRDGLPMVAVRSEEANGEVYLHGGHVTSWKPKDSEEALYLSPKSLFQPGHAIRGGIPVCFPWFGDKTDNPTAPAHGFVRTKAWELASIERSGQDVVVSMSTESSDDARKWWPYDFRLLCRASFGRQLKVELIVTNTDAASFTFEEALHAYFAVKDAKAAFVRGLNATFYLDKTDNRREKMQSGDIHFSAETDRVYLDTEHDVELVDPAGKRHLNVRKRNSRTTVLWNPWSEKSTVLKDLGANQWKSFVCIESSNVAPFAIKLEPGESHTMAAVISVAAGLEPHASK